MKLELKLFLLFLVAAGTADILSMKKAKLKKEFLPYIVLMVLTAVFGIAYMSTPQSASLTFSVIKFLGLKGF